MRRVSYPMLSPIYRWMCDIMYYFTNSDHGFTRAFLSLEFFILARVEIISAPMWNISTIEIICQSLIFNRSSITHKSVYRVTLWVYNIYYEMLRMFSNFIPLPLYFDGWCFSKTLLNSNIISKSIQFSPSLQIVLLLLLVYVFVNCYVHWVNSCYSIEVRISWVQVIIDITPSPFYANPWLLAYLFLACLI